MNLPTFEVDETTLVFAFRYALGRQSTAPSHMVAALKEHWNHGLKDWTKDLIKREIQEAIDGGIAGDRCDIATWQQVLDWGNDDCPKCQMVYHNCLCSHED